MKRTTIAAATAALIMTTSSAFAGGGLLSLLSGEGTDRYMGDVPTAANAVEIPPVGFQGQIWTASNGCKYTRAGRPGETVWYLIMNSLKGQSCDRLIVEHVLDDNIQMAKLAMR